MKTEVNKNTKTATFGAGCFWGVEYAYTKLLGVVKTEVGFMGGDKKDPSYENVCAGDTGHAEVLKIEYDPEKISYKELLDKFWEVHDPTQINAQGLDIGAQYRSVIFYYSEDQKKEAGESLKVTQKKFDKPIVTAIESTSEFYKAEEYHQKYFEKTGQKVCHS